jgi:glycosyltransferase involved in cell wall biosynthesis
VRLGLYIPVLDERPAGVGVYIEEVCSRLVAQVRDVVVFTGTPAVPRPWLKEVEVRPLGRRLLAGMSGLEGPRRRARRLRWLMTSAAGELPAAGVDVLFSPVQEGPLVGAVPSVVVMHDLTALKYPEAYGRLTVAQTRWLVPLMLRRAAAVVAVSANTKRDVLETFHLPEAKVHVIGEGFDRAVFRPRSEQEIEAARTAHGIVGPYLLYAGTFSRHKNLGLVLRALATLGAESERLQLVLVGRKDAGAFEEFRALASALGLEGRVVTPGYVSRDELAALMSGADAFVYPSRYEGFGLAPLEAMACGAPVVASAVASLPEVVGEGGVLVPSAEPGDWAAALREVLAAPREAMAARALSQSRRFDWDEAASKLLLLLQSVVSRGAS